MLIWGKLKKNNVESTPKNRSDGYICKNLVRLITYFQLINKSVRPIFYASFDFSE